MKKKPPAPQPTAPPAPEAPAGLSPEACNLWRAVAGKRAKTAPRLALLELALTAYDRAREAGEMVARDGATFTTKTGTVHANPALKTERDSMALFIRAWQTLGLHKDPAVTGWRAVLGSSLDDDET